MADSFKIVKSNPDDPPALRPTLSLSASPKEAHAFVVNFLHHNKAGRSRSEAERMADVVVGNGTDMYAMSEKNWQDWFGLDGSCIHRSLKSNEYNHSKTIIGRWLYSSYNDFTLLLGLHKNPSKTSNLKKKNLLKSSSHSSSSQPSSLPTFDFSTITYPSSQEKDIPKSSTFETSAPSQALGSIGSVQGNRQEVNHHDIKQRRAYRTGVTD